MSVGEIVRIGGAQGEAQGGKDERGKGEHEDGELPDGARSWGRHDRDKSFWDCLIGETGYLKINIFVYWFKFNIAKYFKLYSIYKLNYIQN